MIDTATIPTPTIPGLELALELAGIERHRWDEVRAGIPAWHPRLDGDDDAGDGDDDGDDDTGTGTGSSTGDDDTDGDDDVEARVTAAERAAAAANRELKKLKAEKAKDAEAAKRKAGEFESLYEEAKAELEKLRGDVAAGAKRSLVEAALTKAKAKNPAKVARLIDLEDIEDASDAERAVKRLTKEDPYLFDTTPTRQKRAAGGKDDEDESDDRKRKPGVSRLRRGLEATSGSTP